VQFDHVLAVGVPRGAVQAVGTPASPISDHRPLIVTLRQQ
jgi:endonuclease/exonuclease/phosphatase (EEP) superfamily protein YafD